MRRTSPRPSPSVRLRVVAVLEIVGLIAPFFGLIALGYGAGRLFAHPASGLVWLNVFVVYLALPALLFTIISRTPVDQLTRVGFIAATTSGTAIVFALTVLIGLARTRGDLAAAAIQGFAGAYGNIGFMGPGLAIAAFGNAASVPIALIFCFDNTFHFVMAPLLMALAGDRAGGPVRIAARTARRIVLHPFILATILGICAAASGLRPPEPIARTLALLSDAAAPCALFAMGVTLAGRTADRIPGEMVWLLPIKLVVHPFVVWCTLGFVPDVDPVWLHTALLMASLPAATSVYVIAQQYGVWVERASATILFSTALSVVTVACLLYLVRHGVLPASPFL